MSQLTREAFDTAAASLSPKITFVGSVVTAIGGVFERHGTWITGLLIGLLGLWMQWYFKNREDQRRQAESDVRVAKLRRMHTDRMPLEPLDEMGGEG